MNRRGFFDSLGKIIGVATVAPTLFIPKFEPVKWKVKPVVFNTQEYVFNPREYMGKWRFISGEGVVVEYLTAIKPEWPGVEQFVLYERKHE